GCRSFRIPFHAWSSRVRSVRRATRSCRARVKAECPALSFARMPPACGKPLKKRAVRAMNTYAQGLPASDRPLPLPHAPGPPPWCRTKIRAIAMRRTRTPNTTSLERGNMQPKRNLLSAALASAIALSATGVHAQETATDATNLDTVTVTGIRRGIESAISVKRDSTSIVEAISAEDIGKLPDVSIAESIARLPGLAAQRVAGRAQVISVRGLSPDFATTLLNGREMVSTGDNRSVEFDQYPSELINGVTVYKTPDSGLVGQGLSGTIDMQTVRPLSFSERVISVGARYQKNSLG